MCSRLFVSAFQKQVAFIAAAFRLDSSREKTGCYVQMSAATVYAAL